MSGVTSPSIWVAVIVTLLITNQEGPYKLLLRHEVPTTMITMVFGGLIPSTGRLYGP